MKERLLDINPALLVHDKVQFVEVDECDALVEEGRFDYIIDCIDSLQPKLHLIKAALMHSTPIVSSMGAGGKLDPAKVMLCDISETDTDPFAAFIRQRLRKQFGILSGVACVLSTEKPNPTAVKMTDGANYKRSFYGTCSYIPCLFGLFASSLVIREIGLNKKVMYTKSRRPLLKQGRAAAKGQVLPEEETKDLKREGLHAAAHRSHPRLLSVLACFTLCAGAGGARERVLPSPRAGHSPR